MTKATEVLRGHLNKECTKVTFTMDIEGIDWRTPISVSSKGNASYKFNEKYQFELVDKDGITVPLTASIGLYMDRKNWKEYQEQVKGHQEAKELDDVDIKEPSRAKMYTIAELTKLKDAGLLSEDAVKELVLQGQVLV